MFSIPFPLLGARSSCPRFPDIDLRTLQTDRVCVNIIRLLANCQTIES
jgi:hypothetical protein